MQLQRRADGLGYWEIREVLTKGPMADWLEQEENKLIARASHMIEAETYDEVQSDAHPCSVSCQEDCNICPRFLLYALLNVRSWELGN